MEKHERFGIKIAGKYFYGFDELEGDHLTTREDYTVKFTEIQCDDTVKNLRTFIDKGVNWVCVDNGDEVYLDKNTQIEKFECYKKLLGET